ncbi:MAG: chemotaxis protein CheA [Phycisphaerales bacterium]
MALRDQIEDLCKAAVMADPDDLPGLASVHDRLQAVEAGLADPGHEGLAQCLRNASKLIEQIVLQEAQNVSEALDLVRRAVDYTSEALRAEERGSTIESVGGSPFEDPSRRQRPAADRVDEQLLHAWLAELSIALGDLEADAMTASAPGDGSEAVAQVRRVLHTLKGECGVLPLPAAQQLCHDTETAIEAAAESGARFPADGVFALVDWFREYADALRNDAHAPAPDTEPVHKALGTPAPAAIAEPAPAIPQETPAAAATTPQQTDADPVAFPAPAELGDNIGEILGECREHIANAETALLELEREPESAELVNTVFRSFHTIKSVASLGNLSPMVRLAHSAEYLLDAARSGRVAVGSDNLSLVLRACDQMSQMIRAVEGGGPAPSCGQLRALVADLEVATTGTATPAAPESAGVLNAHPVAPPAAPSIRPPEPVPTAPAAQEPEAAAPGDAAPAPTQSAKRSEQTVKVSTSRMDALVDMVGELVIAQQMVVQDPTLIGVREPRLSRSLTMVGKIIRDLQEISMSLRMVPIKGTFQKMARLVRDISTKAGKRIELRTDGEDVELDRNVVEVIADPLVHMIRNACDHGVESPEKRIAAGKPPVGNILLRACHSGGSILVEIVDDGKGLDRERILAKAIERGVFVPDRPLDEIPDADIFNLIFLPGFSTAETVTDLSGRGVGMDVVRRNIEALRGKVEISSTRGQGTTFTMRLPLTLAIIDGMVVRVGAQRYVIPTLSIERSFQPRPGEIHTVAGRGRMASVRGGLLPILRLEQVLHGSWSGGEDENLLIVVECQESRACFAVDEIIGQQQVVIKSLGRSVQSVRGVSGGAILGDGRVALILDVAGILAQAETGALAP